MALYDYPRSKHPDAVLSQFMRRPADDTDTTVAMHWDGTYRDRNAYMAGFWTDEEYEIYGVTRSSDLASPQHFAKHLASDHS